MATEVLLCSPKGIPGGISQWTENVIDFGVLHPGKVNISWFYISENNKLETGLNPVTRLIRGLNVYLPFLSGLKKRLKKGHYDVVHFSTSASISLIRDYLALRICKKAGVRTVLHLHYGRTAAVLQSNSWEKKLLIRCLHLSDTVIAMDRKSYEALINNGFTQTVYVPNPYSPQVEKLIQETPDIKPEKNLIIFAGHVIPTKGVIELVEACKDIPDIKLEIMGLCSDQMRSQLMDIAGDNSEKWLNIRGNCSHDQVIEAMKRCAVFVLPSYFEGFPNVIIEAMACKTPILATSVGAIPEMLDIDGKEPCGIVIPPKDVNILKEKIRYILKNQVEARKMGENAHKRVSAQYSIPRIWDLLVDVWNN